jgi:hypothetical protein
MRVVGSVVGKLYLECFADQSEAGHEVLEGVLASIYLECFADQSLVHDFV